MDGSRGSLYVTAEGWVRKGVDNDTGEALFASREEAELALARAALLGFPQKEEA